MQCSVEGCTTTSKSLFSSPRFREVHPVIGVRFFRFPRNCREKWCEVLNIDPKQDNWDNVRVCSRHFSAQQYITAKIERVVKTGSLLANDQILLRSAVPDRCLPGQDPEEYEDDDPPLIDNEESKRPIEMKINPRQEETKQTCSGDTEIQKPEKEALQPIKMETDIDTTSIKVECDPDEGEPSLKDVLALFDAIDETPVKAEEVAEDAPGVPNFPTNSGSNNQQQPNRAAVAEVEDASKHNVYPKPAKPYLKGLLASEKATVKAKNIAEDAPGVPNFPTDSGSNNQKQLKPAVAEVKNAPQSNVGPIPAENPNEDKFENSALKLLLSVAFNESAAYKGICSKVYDDNVPEHAVKSQFCFEKYPAEVVSSQFLEDTNLMLLEQDKRTAQLKKQIEESKEKLAIIDAKIEKLKTDLEVTKEKDAEMMTALNKQFTKVQLDRMVWNKSIPWSEHEFNSALALLTTGERAYSIIGETVPLPSASELLKFLASVEIRPGVMEGVVHLMDCAGKALQPLLRVCVLSFCRVPVAYKLAVSRSKDQVVGPLRFMQVAQVSGLFSPWTQPVYYEFGQKMEQETLMEILTAVHKADFTVVAVACDLRAENQKLLKKLLVSAEKPFFSHPATQEPVYLVPEASHCLKLLCNRLLDEGIDLNPQEEKEKLVASRWALQELVNSGMPQNPLTQDTLNKKIPSDVLSLKVAEALRALGSTRGEEERRAFEATAKVCEGGSWFNDLLSVSEDRLEANIPAEKLPFGRQLTEQCEQLLHISEAVRNARVLTKSSGTARLNMVASQVSIDLCCKALPLLFEHLDKKFPGEKVVILTSQLSLDSLKKFLGLWRTLFGANTQPDVTQAEERMKMLCLCNNFGVPSRKSNAAVIERVFNEQEIGILSLLGNIELGKMIEREGFKSKNVPGPSSADRSLLGCSGAESVVYKKYKSSVEDAEEDKDADWDEVETDSNEGETAEEWNADWTPPDSEQDPCYMAGLSHLAEEMAFILCTLLPEVKGKTREREKRKKPDWMVEDRPQSETASASINLVKKVKKLDAMFRDLNKNYISMQPNQTKAFIKAVKEKHHNYPTKIIRLFFQMRRQIRINQINRAFFQRKEGKGKRKAVDNSSKGKHAKRRRVSKK
ncbi:Hypothetical predicted protein [Cloeon dipterum]|uniref:THAP-type domain-containing protein n=1 Tax=Cloeon dipterum TaxID=197152 RepID=A0A8S1DP36_9INSE|nr:Hypothetical predicted protein [Cloeon dipterum]